MLLLEVSEGVYLYNRLCFAVVSTFLVYAHFVSLVTEVHPKYGTASRCLHSTPTQACTLLRLVLYSKINESFCVHTMHVTLTLYIGAYGIFAVFHFWKFITSG